VCSNSLSLCPRPSSQSDTSSAWWWKSSGRPKIMNTGTHKIHSFIHPLICSFIFSIRPLCIHSSGFYAFIYFNLLTQSGLHTVHPFIKLSGIDLFIYSFSRPSYIQSSCFNALIYSFIYSVRPSYEYIQSSCFLELIYSFIYSARPSYDHSSCFLALIC
jgi:hypothetical protein